MLEEMSGSGGRDMIARKSLDRRDSGMAAAGCIERNRSVGRTGSSAGADRRDEAEFRARLGT